MGPYHWLAIIAVVVVVLCIVGANKHLATVLGSRGEVVPQHREGKLVAQNQLRAELYQVVHQFKLTEEPNAQLPLRWREAFQILFSEKIEPAQFNEHRAHAALTDLGFGDDQAESLISWRQQQPHTLVTVILAVLTGQPDDDIWMMGAKGSLV